MTVLSACQSAGIRLIGEKPPTSVFSSTDQFAVELADMANEVARDIAQSHDWQALIGIHTLVGDGTATEFDLPADYDRMMLDTSIYDETNWAWGYQRVNRVDEWLSLKIKDFGLINPGVWTLFDNQLQFLPAPDSGAQAQFVYIKNGIVTDENGTAKAQFTADGDTFNISERLLTLGIIWRWRENKRLDYAADQANFEKAFSEISGKDGGARPIKSYSVSGRRNVRYAYPWTLG